MEHWPYLVARVLGRARGPAARMMAWAAGGHGWPGGTTVLLATKQCVP